MNFSQIRGSDFRKALKKLSIKKNTMPRNRNKAERPNANERKEIKGNETNLKG
jgi:hypothetical protein